MQRWEELWKIINIQQQQQILGTIEYLVPFIREYYGEMVYKLY
jgi:hypothetical protein